MGKNRGKGRNWLRLLPLLCLAAVLIGGGLTAFAEETLELETPHAILMEASTGQILFEKDAGCAGLSGLRHKGYDHAADYGGSGPGRN